MAAPDRIAPTNSAEFEKFHRCLMQNAPSAYVPHYRVARPKSKVVWGAKGEVTTVRLDFDVVRGYIDQGYNGVIYAIENSGLVILDEDEPGLFPDLKKPTLTVKTRSGGHHYYYFSSDSRIVYAGEDGEPDEAGKRKEIWSLRINDYYAITPGSYADPQADGKTGSPGGYIVEDASPPMHISFEDLPERVRIKLEAKSPEQKPKGKRGRRPRKNDSKLWDFEKGEKGRGLIDKILSEFGIGGEREFAHPFHGSETGLNCKRGVAEDEDGENIYVIQCWRTAHCVSFTPLRFLYLWMLYERDKTLAAEDCRNIGAEMAHGRTKEECKPSTLDVHRDIEKMNELHAFAIAKGVIPEDDPLPFAKKGERKNIIPKAYLEADGLIYHQVKGSKWAQYDPTTKMVLDYVSEIPGHKDIVPIPDDWGVALPEELEDCEPDDLFQRVLSYLKAANDQADDDLKILALFMMDSGCFEPGGGTRHHPLLVPFGSPATGKSVIGQTTSLIGPRGFIECDPTSATVRRMNEGCGGAYIFFDESDENDERLMTVLRLRHDPLAKDHKIVDAKDPLAVRGYNYSGPSCVPRRTPFPDDANTDRAIQINCERGTRFPMEIPKQSLADAQALQNKLVKFWLDNIGLAIAEEDVWYDKEVEEGVSPRLVLAYRKFKKIADLCGVDIEGFRKKQIELKRQQRSLTEVGQLVNAIYGLLIDGKLILSGRKTEESSWTGTYTPDVVVRDGRKFVAVLFTKEDAGEKDQLNKGVTFRWLQNATGIKAELQPPMLAQYGVVKERWTNRLRTIAFEPEKFRETCRDFVVGFVGDDFERILPPKLQKQTKLP